MQMDHIAVVDVETTGLSPWRHDRVVEIAIVVISPDGMIQTEYETLINPSRDIGPSSIHHISAADVLRAPTFADVAGDILEILAAASVVAGHNVSFDKNSWSRSTSDSAYQYPKSHCFALAVCLGEIIFRRAATSWGSPSLECLIGHYRMPALLLALSHSFALMIRRCWIASE